MEKFGLKNMMKQCLNIRAERPGEEEMVQFKLRTENYAKLDCGITGKMPD